MIESIIPWSMINAPSSLGHLNIPFAWFINQYIDSDASFVFHFIRIDGFREEKLEKVFRLATNWLPNIFAHSVRIWNKIEQPRTIDYLCPDNGNMCESHTILHTTVKQMVLVLSLINIKWRIFSMKSIRPWAKLTPWHSNSPSVFILTVQIVFSANVHRWEIRI